MTAYALSSETVRDLFGFTLAGLTEAEQRARAESQAAARSQVKAWLKRIKDEDARMLYNDKRKLKTLVRKGLPPELRPEIWMILSGAKFRKAEAPKGLYQTLSGNGDKIDGVGVALEVSREVQRTFRHHHAFRGSSGFRAVRRVLGAFLKYNPHVGCVPGMTAAVAFVLTVIGFHREEDAFWVFVSIVEEGLFRGVGEQMLFWCKVQEKVLGALATEKVPRVHRQFLKLGCTASAVTNTWFSSLFVLTLPAETAVRVWDSLICEGPKVLLRVGLALLKKCEATILMTTEVRQLSQIISYKLRRVFDANELLNLAFNRLGRLTSAQICGIHNEMELVIERDIEEKAGRLAIIQGNQHVGSWQMESI